MLIFGWPPSKFDSVLHKDFLSRLVPEVETSHLDRSQHHQVFRQAMAQTGTQRVHTCPLSRQDVRVVAGKSHTL